MELIQRECNRLNRFVTDLLNYSRERELAPEALNLEGVLAELRDQIARDPRCMEGCEVRFRPRGLPVTVRVDRELIRQVWLNLAVNALEAMSGKGVLTLDWEEGDFAIVHTEAVHRHYNASKTERALALVIKAKATWMHLGLWQQGRSKEFDLPGYGPRQDWSRLWSPDATSRKKVVKRADTKWENTRDGRIRVISSPERTDVRSYAVDLYEQEIQPGGSSAKHWHMADEVAYVISGQGYSEQWEVTAEIAERYYARVAKEPTRHEFKADDTVYVPQNHVHRYVSTGDEALRLLIVQNRLLKTLGYATVRYVEDAPEYAGVSSAAAVAS